MPNAEDALRILEVDTHSGNLVTSDGSVVNEADVIDPTTDALCTVTETQAAIHRKKAFSISARGSIVGGGTLDLLFITGAVPVHFMDMDFTFDAGGELLTLFEAPTVSANGASIPIIAMNRIVPLSISSSTAFVGPTVTATGTQISIAEGFSAAKGIAPVSFAGGRVLAPNTKYLFRVENLTLNTALGYTYSMSFHEA